MIAVGGAVALAAARMGPLALVAAPFGRAWCGAGDRGRAAGGGGGAGGDGANGDGDGALPTEIVVGLLLGVVAALPFAAAEAAGALVDGGVHPWRARRGERGPLAEAYCCSRWRCLRSPTGRGWSLSRRARATWRGRSGARRRRRSLGVGAQLVATAVALAAPALAAMLVAELVLALVARVQPALGRAVDAAPLRALAVLLVAAAAVYSVAHVLAPTMSGAAHLQVAP